MNFLNSSGTQRSPTVTPTVRLNKDVVYTKLFDYLLNHKINEIQGELASQSHRSQGNQQNDYLSLSRRIDQLVLVNHSIAEIICQRLGIFQQGNG